MYVAHTLTIGWEFGVAQTIDKDQDLCYKCTSKPSYKFCSGVDPDCYDTEYTVVISNFDKDRLLVAVLCFWQSKFVIIHLQAEHWISLALFSASLALCAIKNQSLHFTESTQAKQVVVCLILVMWNYII